MGRIKSLWDEHNVLPFDVSFNEENESFKPCGSHHQTPPRQVQLLFCSALILQNAARVISTITGRHTVLSLPGLDGSRRAWRVVHGPFSERAPVVEQTRTEVQPPQCLLAMTRHARETPPGVLYRQEANNVEHCAYCMQNCVARPLLHHNAHCALEPRKPGVAS